MLLAYQAGPLYDPGVVDSFAFRGLLAVGALASFGCSVATEEPRPLTTDATTYAIVQVQSHELLGEPARADAMATFLRVPASADPAEVMTLAGLRDSLPSVGECRGDDQEESAALSQLGDVELVDAEWVHLETPIGTHDLAPHAFPTVTDWIRGVVYASRNRSPTDLPSDAEYRFAAEQVEGLGDLEALHFSPPLPAQIMLDGRPLVADSLVPPGQSEITVSWAPSADALDKVALRLNLGGTRWTCVYDDSAGQGVVPLVSAGEAVPTVGTRGEIAVHRIRALATSHDEGASMVEMNFDFSVQASLRVDEIPPAAEE